MSDILNKIVIGEKTFELKPIKMKYMKDNFYNCYLSIKKFGLMKILCYEDGSFVVDGFLKAIFDNNEIDIDYIKEELDTKVEKELLEKVKKINEIEDEDDLKNV